jgi:NAD(P)-dependent dehydrogenase (short-subunit alcohol dehydrogenase family)
MAALLDGQAPIVTGGATGIGRACVERLINVGAQVLLTDTDSHRPAAARLRSSRRGAPIGFAANSRLRRLGTPPGT